MRRLYLSCGLLVVVAVAFAGCNDEGVVIVDDWGPPAGYTVIAGIVRHNGGAPAVGVEVGFSRCSQPVGGFLASSRSDQAGRFRATGALAPILPSGIADTLRVRCYVFLDRTGIIRDSVTVGFARTLEAAPVTTIALEVP